MKELFSIIFLGVFSAIFAADSYFCNKEFCDSYLATATCIQLPEACKAQNVTHNGIFLPHPGPCNCCEYCLENILLDDTCAVGDPSSPTPTSICGSGLACEYLVIEDKTVCKTIDTPCTQEQAKYDNDRKEGNLGHLQVRPECDRNGLYVPYTCVPGEICYCLSEDGERIFGEIPFTSDPQYTLRCKCSRNYVKGKKIKDRDLHHEEFLRCVSNGDYDVLQCVEDKCMCTDSEDGHLTYPDMRPVNLTSISAENLTCFNNKTHLEGEYYRECEAEYAEQLSIIKQYEKEGLEVFGYTLPNCQLDGHFAPVQGTETVKYCSDPFGRRLEDYEVLLSDDLASSMDCKCARTRYVMVGDEKPTCCKNGNYQKMQCRRGMCRCVDENGQQNEKEVEYAERKKLSCFAEMCIFI